MTVPNDVLKLIKEREGFSSKVYTDTLGKMTVGYGHLLNKQDALRYHTGEEVPEDVIDSWFFQDTLTAYHAAIAQSLMIGFDDPRLTNALASVSFQLGALWYRRFPKCWAALMANNWKEAALEAEDSAWNRETPVRVKDFTDVLRSL